MRKVRKQAFLVTLILALALLILPFGTLTVSATEGSDRQVTATTNASVKQGNTGYCYVYIDSLEALSSLSVTAHYDPERVRVDSSNVYNTVSCILNDKALKESSVQFSYIFDGNGEAAKTQLFYFKYTVLSDAEIGDSYFDIVVNEAYDSSLQAISVSGSRCPFSITETITSKSCSIYSTSSISTSIEQEFELSYNLSSSQIASGSFVINYDPELFAIVGVTNGSFCNGKIVDVNTEIAGAAYVSFVGTSYNGNTSLLRVKFKTLQNVAQASTIKMTVTEFFDLELNPISCSGYTTTANIRVDETYTEDSPNMSLRATYDATTDKVTLTVKLDKDSMLGAGDFVLNFNQAYLTYSSTQKGFAPTFFNINDKDATNGILKFSILSLSDIIDEQTVLTVVFDVKHSCMEKTIGIEISGSGLTDSLTNSILLNFVNTSVVIPALDHNLVVDAAVAPTCTKTGLTEGKHCLDCGLVTIAQEEIPALGHTEVVDDAVEPNCTETGLTEGKHCSVCNQVLVAQNTVNALGHTEVITPATPASCTESGLSEGRYCSVCNEVLVEQVVVDPLGHRVLIEDRVWVDPITFTNDSNHPFVVDNGVYGSTNKVDNSDSYFTITATYNCTLTISYSVSSEQNYDKLIIRRNGSIVAEISGVVDWRTKTLNLVAGDVVTINYHKDVSVKNNQDTGWFSFAFEQIEVDAITTIPAEDVEATCSHAVTCDFCDKVVKDAIPHSMTLKNEISAPTCATPGSAEYECSVCQQTETRPVAALEHNYSTEWTVDVEPTCTTLGSKSHHCLNCGNQTDVTEIETTDHVYTRKVTTDDYKVSDATCTAKAVYNYCCATCDTEGTTTYEHGNTLEHNYTKQVITDAYKVSDADCDSKAVYNYCCATCDAIGTNTFEYGEALGHTGGAATCTVKAECSRCHQSYGKTLDHVYTDEDAIATYLKSEATCTSKAVYYKNCATCDKAGEETFEHGSTGTHSFTKQVTADFYKVSDADCDSKAVYNYCCATCNAKGSNTFEFGDVLGHTGGTATCTTKAECSRCHQSYGDTLEHSYTKQVITDAYKVSNADCDSKAVYNYCCATCNARGTNTFEYGEALGHTGGTATCTAKAECIRCGEEYGDMPEHVYTAEDATDAYLKSAATCTSKAVYYKNCATCDKAGATTFEYGSTKAHTYTEKVDGACLKSAASCTAKAVYYKSCSVCGVKGTETFEVGETPSHSYQTTWNTDASSHWHECTKCGDKKDLTSHTAGAAATESTAQTCTICGYVITPALGHAHNYNTRWSNNATEHWHDCVGCSSTKDNAPHDYTNACDTDCNTCGYVRTITHSYKTEWSSNVEKHWYECSVCGDKSSEASHIPGVEATETTDQVCTVCNFVIQEALGHTHNFNSSKNDETNHWKECACGEKNEITAHTWNNGEVTKEATVDEEGVKTYTCTVCGQTKDESIAKLPPQTNVPDNTDTPKEPDEKDGLSGGAIAGIAASSTVAAGAGGFSLFWFVIKKKRFSDLLKVFKKK